jgi:hypothetical protein
VYWIQLAQDTDRWRAVVSAVTNLRVNKILLETSVLSTFNHLTRLEAQENFINLSRRESLKSYNHRVLSPRS